jgi:hypothetical protein
MNTKTNNDTAIDYNLDIITDAEALLSNLSHMRNGLYLEMTAEDDIYPLIKESLLESIAHGEIEIELNPDLTPEASYSSMAEQAHLGTVSALMDIADEIAMKYRDEIAEIKQLRLAAELD